MGNKMFCGVCTSNKLFCRAHFLFCVQQARLWPSQVQQIEEHCRDFRFGILDLGLAAVVNSSFNHKSPIRDLIVNESDLKDRTKQFGLRIMKLVDALPNTISRRAIGNQLIRSGTSVGANYRAACRGRSKPEFIAKLGIVIEEADECGYWLELIMESNLLPENQVLPLHKEADELTAICTASVRTTKSKIKNHNSKIK